MEVLERILIAVAYWLGANGRYLLFALLLSGVVHLLLRKYRTGTAPSNGILTLLLFVGTYGIQVTLLIRGTAARAPLAIGYAVFSWALLSTSLLSIWMLRSRPRIALVFAFSGVALLGSVLKPLLADVRGYWTGQQRTPGSVAEFAELTAEAAKWRDDSAGFEAAFDVAPERFDYPRVAGASAQAFITRDSITGVLTGVVAHRLGTVADSASAEALMLRMHGEFLRFSRIEPTDGETNWSIPPIGGPRVLAFRAKQVVQGVELQWRGFYAPVLDRVFTVFTNYPASGGSSAEAGASAEEFLNSFTITEAALSSAPLAGGRR